MRISTKNNKKLLPAFSFGLLLAVLVLTSTHHVSAWTVKARWVDRAHIQVDSIELTDDDYKGLGVDTTNILDVKGVNEGLKSVTGIYTSTDIETPDTQSFGHSAADCGVSSIVASPEGINSNSLHFQTIEVKTVPDPTKTAPACVPLVGPILFSAHELKPDDHDKASIWFNWDAQSNDIMNRVDGKDGAFKKEKPNEPKWYASNSGNSCGGSKAYVITSGTPGQDVDANYETCGSAGIIAVKVAKRDSATLDKPESQSGVGSTTSQGTARCESGGLSWVICPIINALAGASDTIFTKFVKPALETDSISVTVPPAGSGQHNYIFEAWSNLRIYGNILLVIGMLIIVFGQSIGGGLIDAYTAKKVMPRILAAAIMINLSIYIVAALVDITNIIGNGINVLITSLIQGPGTATINLSLSSHASILPIAGLVGAGGAVWALGTTLIQPLLLFILLPLLIALIGVVVTIVLRQGLIMLLIIVSPIAFALYCLPNTEQYFRKWWKLLFEALLVYPIVGAIFGIANLMAVTINQANTTGATTSAVAQIISVIVLIIPLFLIPYAFKLAGGLLGNLHAQLTGFGKKAHQGILGRENDPRSARNRARYNMGSRFNQRRATTYGNLANTSTKGGLLGGLAGGAARAVNYGNLQAERATMNEEQEKIIAAQYSQGDDANIRALWAKRQAVDEYARDSAGNFIRNKDGERVISRKAGHYYSYYKNPDGSYKEWAASDVAKAESLVAKDPSRLQAYAKYEVGKAAEGNDLYAFEDRLAEKMNDYNYDRGTGEGVWAGVKFAHQQTRREEKHRGLTGGTGNLAMGKINHGTLSRELDDSVRSYDFANFRPETAKESEKGFLESLARERNNTATPEDAQILANYRSVANNLSSVFSSNPGQFRPDGDETPGQGYAARGTGGSARSEAAWKDFVRTVQSNTTQPSAPGGGSTTSGAGPTPGGPGGGRPGATGTPSGAGNGEGLIIP